MAVTSIWRVKGWLGKLVIYVENPDKTTNPKLVKAEGLEDVLRYAVNSQKTQKADDEDAEILHSFVSGINCHPSTARQEMNAVKKRFGKEGGVVAYHGYQSFAPGEATPEIAHEIGVKLAQELWGEGYQVIVATHLDKENHLHSHFVVNTVSFVNGIRYHRTAKDYHDMRTVSDRLCREYNLSVIENPQFGQSKHYGEWRAEQEQRPTWRGMVRSDVDEAIRQSMTERQFFDALRQKGYEIKVGKDISVRPLGKERFVRLTRNFGDDYSLEGIRRRLLAQRRRTLPLSEPKKLRRRGQLRESLKNTRKITGFQALYFHYCYLLGIYPRRKQNPKRLHFLLREDLLKMEAISKEARLLAAHDIDTAEQLSLFQGELEAKITQRTDDRKRLYRKQRTADVRDNEALGEEVRREIALLTRELKQLREEVKLCEDIAVRSGIMTEKLKSIQEDRKQTRKERNQYEQHRRCGRTDRSIEP